MGKIQWSGRSLTLLDPTYASKYIPIIASVSEHQPTTWTSFFFDLHILVPLAPVGLFVMFTNITDGEIPTTQPSPVPTPLIHYPSSITSTCSLFLNYPFLFCFIFWQLALSLIHSYTNRGNFRDSLRHIGLVLRRGDGSSDAYLGSDRMCPRGDRFVIHSHTFLWCY